MTKLRVGLLFGGCSGEHEVSIRSAKAIATALSQGKNTTKYEGKIYPKVEELSCCQWRLTLLLNIALLPLFGNLSNQTKPSCFLANFSVYTS